MTRPWIRTAALAAAVCAVPLGASATPINTAQSIYFDKTAATAACQQGVNDLDPSSAVNNWRNALRNRTTLGPNDNTVFWSEMADPVFGGQDNINSNADTADMLFIAGHGGGTCGTHNCTQTDWSFHLTTSSGAPDNECAWHSASAAKIGNFNAEFVVAFACFGMEPTYTPILNNKTPFLHQWYGFTGTMATGTGTSDHTDDFINESFLSGSSAALEWLENELSKGHWGGTADVCPTVMIRGSSKGDYEHRRDREHFIETSFSHPTGAWTQTIFNCGCNPPGNFKPLC